MVTNSLAFMSVLLAMILAAAVLLAILLAQRVAHRREIAALENERARLLDKTAVEEESARVALAETGRLQGQNQGLQKELDERNQAITALKAEGEIAADKLIALEKKNAELSANLEHTGRANAELRTFLDLAPDKLKGAFAELAGKIFDERGKQFAENVQKATQQSKADIDSLLKPFADRIGEFRARVDVLYGDEAKERASLLGAVNSLKTLNEDMADKTEALTRALKGSAKVRGDWGELMLESVLRGSGLEEGTHYQKQESRTDEDGQKFRPDVVVYLPDQRRVVVDSKVNLISWQAAVNAETPQEHDEAIHLHALALKQHVKELADKNYPKVIGDNALDLTIAFVPIEGALSAALGADHGLQGYAFERKVAFTSPNTLMAMLRVVERLWTRDKISREAEQIGKAGQLLLDSVVNFLDEFDAVGKHLDKARNTFIDARKHLHESDKSVIPRARRLVALRVKSKKPLPNDLLPDTDIPDLIEGE